MEALRTPVLENKIKPEEMSKEQVQEFIESGKKIRTLFEDSRTAKLIMASWMVLDVEEFEIIEEKISGDRAEVTARMRVGAIQGLDMDLIEKPKPKEQKFSLKLTDGRWIITDLSDLLQKHGLSTP